LTADGDLIQRNLDGDPFLQHRTGSKWKLFGPNQPLIAPALTRCCEEAIADLRRRWSGAIFHAPERSEWARAEEAELIARRCFLYEVSNGKARILELLRAGVIGEGRTDLEQHWTVIEREGRLVLQFFSGSRLVVEFLREPDGGWRGAALGSFGFEAHLVPNYGRQTWPHANEERISRSARAEIATLLDPSLFASGFDPETAQELQAALSLLNRLCDNVPEELAAKLGSIKLSPLWRQMLDTLTGTLKNARDARLSATPGDLVAPTDINPLHYSRIF
jgi:hypothetical protein